MNDYIKQHLQRFDLLPVLLPNEQRPGDVFTTDNIAVFYSRAERCFGAVNTAVVRGSNFLPTRELEITKGIEAAVGFSSVAEAKLSWSNVRNLRILYEDVELISSEIAALKSGFKSSEPACSPLSDIVFEKVAAAPKDGRLFVVIGSVVRAKRTLDMALKSDVKVDASVSDLRTLVQEAARGAGFSIEIPEIQARVSGNQTIVERIVLRTTSQIEVAFSPAFVPGLIRKGLAGPTTPDASQIEGVQWTGLDRPTSISDPTTKKELLEALDVYTPQVPTK